MYRRGQLFLIEVIIALSVLVVLIAALFSVQTFSPPLDDTTLRQNGEAAISTMVDNGLMYKYLEDANYSYYTENEYILPPTNDTKIDVTTTIEGMLPSVANFKVYTQRYNTTSSSWDQIDIVHVQESFPSGSDLTIVDYYSPGFNGNFVQFKFQLFLWYEVSS